MEQTPSGSEEKTTQASTIEAPSYKEIAVGSPAPKEWQWLMNNSVKPLVEKPERKSKLNSQAKEAHFTDLIPAYSHE